MEYVDGIDVSRWQGEIDWHKVAQNGIHFAAIRATVGDYYADHMFEQNVQGCINNGILWTAYHVVKPSIDWTRQMGVFWSTLGSLKPDLPVVLDCELDDGQTNNRVTNIIWRCVQDVYSVTDRLPIIYTAPWWWDNNVNDDPLFYDCDLWIANYGVTKPSIPGEWDSWLFWQHSESGVMDGVPSRSLDLDYFNGDMEDLLAYSNLAEVPEGEPPAEEEPSSLQYRVTVNGLNVRSGPGIMHDKVGLLAKGDIVDVQAIHSPEECWVRIGDDEWAALTFNYNEFMEVVE